MNGRGLDVRLRLPPGADALEPRVRERVQAAVARGSISLNLTMKRLDSGGEIRVNEVAMAAVADAVARMRSAIGGDANVNIDGLLALRGVLEYGETEDSEAHVEARHGAILSTLDTAISEMLQGRSAEGRRLESVIVSQIKEVEALVATVATSPARSASAIALRLNEQLARLVQQTAVTVDPARLHQEAMMIATRIDVDEELKRLTAHVAAARELLRSPDPVGRKFDFLTQEFNREANTLCSKANDADITRAGLALKAVIDQMREQVQNIE